MDCSVVTSEVATGYLITPAGADLQDGDTFTLSDGINTATVFEWNSGSVTAGHVKITLVPAESVAQERTRIVTAINGVAGGLLITASNGSGGVVTLVHDRPTTRGNVAITSSVMSMDFNVIGMSGGVGGDCLAGVGCTDDDDCHSHNCSGGTCQ
jgi:hypothetical protein